MTNVQPGIRRKLPAAPEAVDQLCSELRTGLLAELPQSERFAIELLLREALMNAVVHGARNQRSAEIHCEVRPVEGGMKIQVADGGRGFDCRSQSARRMRAGPVPSAPVCQPGAVLGKWQPGGTDEDVPRRGIMNFEIRRQGETAAVVEIHGDVVASSVPELRPALRDLVRSGLRDLVVDLAYTAMIDSTGLGLLLSAFNSLSQVQGKFAVVNASDEVLELFRTLRIHQHFAVAGR
jgi:anti-anti-sigma factor